jgi:hypothetical protein
MESLKIKREIVAVFMESPFYFTIPLQKRLQFVKYFIQKAVSNEISELQIYQETRNNDLRPDKPWLSFL